MRNERAISPGNPQHSLEFRRFGRRAGGFAGCDGNVTISLTGVLVPGSNPAQIRLQSRTVRSLWQLAVARMDGKHGIRTRDVARP